VPGRSLQLGRPRGEGARFAVSKRWRPFLLTVSLPARGATGENGESGTAHLVEAAASRRERPSRCSRRSRQHPRRGLVQL